MADVLERASRALSRVRKNQGTTKQFTDQEEFLAHVEKEFALAAQEEPKVAKRRLEVLQGALKIAKAASWEGGTPVSIPVLETDTTVAKEKTDKPGSFPSQTTATQFSSNSYNEWGKSVQKRLDALKSDGDLSENEDESKPGKKGKKSVGKRGNDDGWPADLAAPGGSNDDDWGSDN
jgi:hypothetical protein